MSGCFTTTSVLAGQTKHACLVLCLHLLLQYKTSNGVLSTPANDDCSVAHGISLAQVYRHVDRFAATDNVQLMAAICKYLDLYLIM